MNLLTIRLSRFEKNGENAADKRTAVMEFHILRAVRERYGLDRALFSLTGNVALANFRQVRDLTAKLNADNPERPVKAGELNAMGLIDEILHYMVALYRQQVQPDVFKTALARLEGKFGPEKLEGLLKTFCGLFPPQKVYAGELTVEAYLAGTDGGESCRALALEEILLLALANLNTAFNPFFFLFDETELREKTIYADALAEMRAYLAELPPFGPDGMNLWDLLRSPALACPDSLEGQLEFMRSRWGLLLGKFMARLLMGLDVIKEENKPVFFGPGPSEVYTYGSRDNEYERFSPDQDWMPRTVLMAKCTLVWLFQLSQKYQRPIERLDQIPDEELDELARRGFTGLWLIGIWERSVASRTIKQWTGNPEAAASAYSLYDYDIAGELGGWSALTNLRDRCFSRGIRLGSDMVPNHTGIDSRWMVEHPDRFLQLPYPPFPTYAYTCGNLSGRDDITVQIEEHYFTRNDAAVVFKRVDNRSGETRYIYHGNDGTSMPWNDTAQIDFLNPEAREAVIRTIVGVCKQFQIVRFDAAMTLAKRHIQRLWYPEPGRGGAIASRGEHAISADEFDRRIPNEFWREVVDRCAAEAPNTLLLAEAFWMMEGYFVRTLGMHRVYNSAFMNMLKNEENAKYRMTIKNTLEFDPEVLKRFVNFLNNPDEETAVAQFGKGDKYFGICTLMVTMPGLPMFGHGQIEGFEEKYGMEYRRAYRDEQPDQGFVARHEREIFPLMRRRMVFSGSADFCLYDFSTQDGGVNENVFAYSNRLGNDRVLVFYNNSYYEASGRVQRGSVGIPQKDGSFRQDTLAQALLLRPADPYFTLFHEHRSGLWYIRSSKDVAENGFFAALKGYEAQVFLDIHEVEDSAQGHWGRLNWELKGRGVQDIYASLEDLVLEELYAAFSQVFQKSVAVLTEARKSFSTARSAPAEENISTKKESISTAEESISAEGKNSPAGKKVSPAGGKNSSALSATAEESIASLAEPVSEFIAVAERYIRGADGRYDPFPVSGKSGVFSAEEIAGQFSGVIRRFLGLDEKTLEGLSGLAFLREDVGTQAFAGAAAGYGLLILLRAVLGRGVSGAVSAALMDHWRLPRKLQEAFRGLDVSGDESYRIAELMRAVLSRTAPLSVAPPQSPNPAENLILENYHAEDFRRILQVNRFEDTIWFNKEAFETALRYVPLFVILESPGAFGKAQARKGSSESALTETQLRKRLKGIAEITGAFASAESQSEYRLEGLLEALSAKPVKPASKKKPAKKSAP